ncbi:MAG: helix-turn-helix domain-containing protein [Bacteroidota bacterium]
MIEIPFNSSVILLGAIIAQGIFAGSLLLFHQKNSYANRFLGWLILAFSLWLIDTFFRTTDVYRQAPTYYFLPIYYSFAFGPLLYFYTKTLTADKFVLNRSHLWHFIPVTLQGGLYLFLRTQDYNFRRSFWFDIHQPYTYSLEFNLSLISLFVYTILSILLVRQYQRWVKNNYSEITKINLQWLRLMLSMIAIICFFWLIDLYLREVRALYNHQAFSAISMGIAVLVLAVGSFRQSNLKGVGVNKVSSSPPLPSGIQQEILGKIEVAMQKDKQFLDPHLTLAAFAKHINEPARLVSQHINHGLNVSFVDFVNGYRVEEVKNHLADGDLSHLSLLGIAMESGFNSKSTFNRIFKKFTGYSPREYAKRAQNAS